MEEVKQSVNCDFTNVMAIKSTIKKGKEELEDIFHSLIEDFKCTTCLPDQFYISLFFRTFGVPWSNEFLWARFDEEGNPKAKCFTSQELIEGGYNLDLCGYPHEEEEILSIKETIINYKKHSEAAEEKINVTLAKITKILGIEL